MKQLTPELLAKIVQSTPQDAEACFDAVVAAMDKYEINNIKRVSAFLATISIECARLSQFEEGLYYKDPMRVATIFRRAFDTNGDKKIDAAELAAATKYTKNPKALSKKLYNGYHGRGPIQITWLKNYAAFKEDTGYDVVTNPDMLLEVGVGFESAAWFWNVNGCNEAADKGSMYNVTTIVNGPARLHLVERTHLYEVALKLLAD